jgi:hypothetical protein
MNNNSMDPWTQRKFDAYEAYTAPVVQVEPLTRQEHRRFFRGKLAEGDMAWHKDLDNALEFDPDTRTLHRMAVRMAVSGQSVRSHEYMLCAIDRAADWYYEENHGNPF